MRVVVIGGGIISDELVSAAPVAFDLSRLPIRRISDNGSSWNSAIEQCRSADIIVYLAYHHRDLPKNIRLLQKILLSLKKADWCGQLIYFNTQSALASKILKSPRPIKEVFCFDLYTTTKRLQSWLLSRYSRQLNISEIYLPVVLGEKTKAQKRFESISNHEVVHLPNKGKNMFAYLDLDVFVHWFWMSYLTQLTQSTNIYRKVFVYQGVRSFADIVRLLQERFRGGILFAANETSPLMIKDCNYKFRFSDSIRSNFLHGLKMTPIWLILSVLRNSIKKHNSLDPKATELCENPITVEKAFYPVGAEYQYLCSTIQLDALPFDTIRIEP